jgi:hypothetical protein
LRFIVTITRKATGAVETFEMIGTPQLEQDRETVAPAAPIAKEG